MTEKDQYYTQEDNQPDTAQTTADNYITQANALDGLVEKTAQQLSDVEQNLGYIHQQADARGDEDTKQAVANTWALTNEMAVRVTQFDATRLASVAMMKKMAEYHAKIAGEYDELEEAINDVDYDHPVVARLVDEVEQYTAESIYETESMWMNEEAMEIAYDHLFTEMHEALRDLTGATSDDWQDILNLRELLMGNSAKVTDEQKRLLRELLDTCRVTPKEAKTL